MLLHTQLYGSQFTVIIHANDKYKFDRPVNNEES